MITFSRLVKKLYENDSIFFIHIIIVGDCFYISYTSIQSGVYGHIQPGCGALCAQRKALVRKITVKTGTNGLESGEEEEEGRGGSGEEEGEGG